VSRRTKYLVLVVLLVAVVNLPLVRSTWTQWRVDRSGVDVTASLVGHERLGSEYWVSFTFPRDIDPDQRAWRAEVTEPTYDVAVASGEIGVRVLADDPAAYEADGAVHSNGPLVATLVADAALLLMVLLFWRFRGLRRPSLRAVAMEDVERCPPGVLLERVDGELYLIRGEVAEIGEGQIVLELGDRSVVVLLDGHLNPVGHQQPAQVRARLVG
jgi:hypothetical protein